MLYVLHNLIVCLKNIFDSEHYDQEKNVQVTAGREYTTLDIEK